MLSPGKRYLQVPKDPVKNLKFRRYVLEAAQGDKRLQKGLVEACRNDVLFFISVFAWQFNARLAETSPFIPWDFQEAVILGGELKFGDGRKVMCPGIVPCAHAQEDMRWPKSRECGASWITLLVMVWACLFHPNIKCLVLSRDADAVDKLDDPDSLFEKVRIILKHLPDWMGKVTQKKLLFKFPNGSVLSGEANVASAGVGGRAYMMLIDEFGQYDKNGEEIYQFTTDTAYCRLFVFTHKDQSGKAYQLCYDAKHAEQHEIVTHWTQHPHKNKGLYKYNANTNQIDILDRSFDFNAICNHNVPKGQDCLKCQKAGSFQPFQFEYAEKPTGGACPGVRSPWYDTECRRRDARDVAMNLDIDPRGATDLFFDALRITTLIASYALEPRWVGDITYDKETGRGGKFVRDPRGPLKLWVHPLNDYQLPLVRAGCGVDVASGSGSTPSCLSMFNADTGEKFGEFGRNDIFANDFATYVFALCQMIEDENGSHPFLVWEIQGGQVFGKRLQFQLHYANVYIRKDEDSIGQTRDNKGRAGWNASPPSILRLTEEYRTAIYQQDCLNRSRFALDECLNIVYDRGTVIYKPRRMVSNASEQGVFHGDIVRADALGWKAIQEMGYVPLPERPKEEPTILSLAGRMKYHQERSRRERRWA